MPINTSELDKLQDRYEKIRNENWQYIENIKFVREKLLHGTEDEKKLIYLCAKLTIDSLNAIIKTMGDQIQGMQNRFS